MPYSYGHLFFNMAVTYSLWKSLYLAVICSYSGQNFQNATYSVVLDKTLFSVSRVDCTCQIVGLAKYASTCE